MALSEPEDDFEDEPTGLIDVRSPVAASVTVPPVAPHQTEAARVMYEATELLSRIGELSHYQLLGVSPDASRDQVHAAYMMQITRFTPESAVKLSVAHKTRLDALFDALSAAHEVLVDADEREAYDLRMGMERVQKRPQPSAPPQRSAPPHQAPVDPSTSAVFTRRPPAPAIETQPPAAAPAARLPTAPYGARPEAPPVAARSPAPTPARAPVAPTATLNMGPMPLQSATVPPRAPVAPTATLNMGPMPLPSANEPSRPPVGVSMPPASQGGGAREALLRSLQARGAMSRAPQGPQSSGYYSHAPLAPETISSKKPSIAPTATDGILKKAKEYEKAGNVQAALSVLQGALSQKEDARLREYRDKLQGDRLRASVAENRKKALAAEGSSNFREAADLWRKVLEAEASDAKAAFHAALCIMRGGDMKGAGQFAKRAVELAPNDANARKLLIKFYESMGMTLNATREKEALKKLT